MIKRYTNLRILYFMLIKVVAREAGVKWSRIHPADLILATSRLQSGISRDTDPMPKQRDPAVQS